MEAVKGNSVEQRRELEAQWASEAQSKALSGLDQVEAEISGLREAISKGEKLSLGRMNFLAALLQAATMPPGAW